MLIPSRFWKPTQHLKICWFSPEEIRRLTLYDVIADTSGKHWPQSATDFDERPSLQVSEKYRRQDGQLVDVEVKANLISYDGRNVFCIIVHDHPAQTNWGTVTAWCFSRFADRFSEPGVIHGAARHAIQLTKRREDYAFAVLFLELDRFRLTTALDIWLEIKY